MDSRKHPAPQPVYLKDYRPDPFRIETVYLEFHLAPRGTRVKSRLSIIRQTQDLLLPLVLQGENLILRAIRLDETTLHAGDYHLQDGSLRIDNVPDVFELSLESEIDPVDNAALIGLYQSSGNFVTQCEAEGFRRITWFLDRPDNLAVFTVRIVADRESYPVLLSNGNRIADGKMDDGRHWVEWHDPFPKPSYLFAMVAGQLAVVRDTFTTRSGRLVELLVYAQGHNIDRCRHALDALCQSMQWDERIYNREYDLDCYMIVAVDDFNFGAMENKGLNVFNSKCVLARPDTATDQDYQTITGIVAHEYFHNWSGNRVTCRDWFQLSLKEGFTVFRDQEFSADMNLRDVKRIRDVNLLRSYQFPEDSSPMAHPVRPASYVEINNFYTTTIYDKGAEVIRMLYNILGADAFYRGCELYFTRHDGQAVTTDDFVRALEDASLLDLGQFRRWYEQAGTPQVVCERQYDAEKKQLRLKLTQHCPSTPGQTDKKPFHIPINMALVDAQGTTLLLRTSAAADELRLEADGRSAVLMLRQAEQSFVFEAVEREPIPSLLRGFSAPVILKTNLSLPEKLILMAREQDPFSKWEAAQDLYKQGVSRFMKPDHTSDDAEFIEALVAAIGEVLTGNAVDNAMKAELVRLPSETVIGNEMTPLDTDMVHTGRQGLMRAIAVGLNVELSIAYDSLGSGAEYVVSATEIGRRSLRNTCLSYLVLSGREDAWQQCEKQYYQANNMTECLAALALIADSDFPHRQAMLDHFHKKWHSDPLVLDKWFSIQAAASQESSIEQIRRLIAHPAFSTKNPNRVRAVFSVLANNNPYVFHGSSGLAYQLLADAIIQLDHFNPQVAARFCTTFSQWRRHSEHRQALMQAQMHRILGQQAVSRDVQEILGKTLGQG